MSHDIQLRLELGRAAIAAALYYFVISLYWHAEGCVECATSDAMEIIALEALED